MTKMVTAYKRIWKIKNNVYTSINALRISVEDMRVIDGVVWDNERHHEGCEFEHDLEGRSEEDKKAFQCICCVGSLVGWKLKGYG